MTYPKMISWSYYSDWNTECLKSVFVQDEVTENEIEQLGFIPMLHFIEVPGVQIQRIDGYSRKAMKFGRLELQYKEKYPELEDKYKLYPLLNGTTFNGFVYTTLPYLSDNQVIQEKTSGIDVVNKFEFIKQELFFDKEFVNALLTYKPTDCFGNEFKDWQNKKLPNFLKNLKIRSKTIYKELLKYDKVRELDESFSYINEKAKVKTLNKGFVKIENVAFNDNCTAYWTGEVIEVIFNNHKSFNTIIIEPTDEMLVVVIDEDTVNDNTVFWNATWE